MSKILVIDDDTTTRLFLRKDLQLEGYEVMVAKDGEEGLEKAQEFQPSVIICDWMMPKMDGLEVCRYVKSDPILSGINFIILTSRESVAHRVEGIDAGADEFLCKPVDLEELHARVRSGVRQYQLKRLMRIANEQLSETLEQLRQTQAQFLQTEKLSSLGQMVAGVVHEINNPVTFIEGNLDFTGQNIANLLELIELYQEYYPEPVAAIKDKIEAIELDFIKEDLPKSLDSMRMGTKRIQKIVSSLRHFSHLNEAELKTIDLHESIENTLLLLQQRLGSGINVVKEYGDLPQVKCYPAMLNQVFFNIISNAIDFLEIKIIKNPNLEFIPTISIRTYTEKPDRIVISIADNGTGMTEEIRHQVFDPFYTTKPVGKGIGMGLTLSYKTVVETHKGELICLSTLGEGTELIVKIPPDQPDLIG
jgi:two-component system, NtrC family, sensor kinase